VHVAFVAGAEGGLVGVAEEVRLGRVARGAWAAAASCELPPRDVKGRRLVERAHHGALDRPR
jgi:hypothetical protein